MKRKRHLFSVGRWVFIPHPKIRGAWLRTDSSVMEAGCDYCGARRGELCKGATSSGRTAGTHSARRQLANGRRRRREKQARRIGRASTVLHVEVPL